MFHGLQTIYRAKNPKVQFPVETKRYKENAVKMERFLPSNFAYARWNNYLHKVIEHADEIIDTRGSVDVFRVREMKQVISYSDTFANTILVKTMHMVALLIV